MPITKPDVLAVLDDPKLMRMSFTVATITVNHHGYREVYEYIQAEDIHVRPGTEPVAFYDGRRNTLITQAGQPPLPLQDRGQLLHECTHALVDIRGRQVVRLHDEVAAYLAQVAYAQMESPSAALRTLSAVGASPLGKLTFALLQVVHRYGLHTSQGFGARISDWELGKLTQAVHAHPDYVHLKAREISVGAGVPVKQNQMRALRAVLKQGHRG